MGAQKHLWALPFSGHMVMRGTEKLQMSSDQEKLVGGLPRRTSRLGGHGVTVDLRGAWGRKERLRCRLASGALELLWDPHNTLGQLAELVPCGLGRAGPGHYWFRHSLQLHMAQGYQLLCFLLRGRVDQAN